MTKLLEISLFLHYPSGLPSLYHLPNTFLQHPVSRANFTRQMDHITPRAAPIPLRERTLERNLERNLGRNLERNLGCPWTLNVPEPWMNYP